MHRNCTNCTLWLNKGARTLGDQENKNNLIWLRWITPVLRMIRLPWSPKGSAEARDVRHGLWAADMLSRLPHQISAVHIKTSLDYTSLQDSSPREWEIYIHQREPGSSAGRYTSALAAVFGIEYALIQPWLPQYMVQEGVECMCVNFWSQLMIGQK
jgi:hypothetical protein